MSDQENHETPMDPVEKPENENGEAELGVVMTIEEFDHFQAELESARVEAQKNLDGWQRAQADYNNLRRRTDQEREQMRNDLTGKILTPFLDVLDDLELAVKNRPTDGQDNGWGEGIELVYRKLLGKLEAQGIRKMEADGQEFDPNLHEAITHEQNENYDSGSIIAVVKPGYVIGDRVLRPAMVRVAA